MADDLERFDPSVDAPREQDRIIAVNELLLNGADAELSDAEWRYLQSLGVPPA